MRASATRSDALKATVSWLKRASRDLAGQAPFVGDPELGRCLSLVGNLTDETKAKLARDAGARLIGFVVVDLDVADLRVSEGGVC